MSTSQPRQPSQPPRRVKLYYYLWLPAGMDEFELGSDGDGHFENTAKYRVNIEGSIAQRLKNIISDNFSEGFWLDEDPEDLCTQDAGLGLRKLEFHFRYDPDPKPGEIHVHRLTNQLAGHAIIFSNGLYLWCFTIDYPSNLTLQEIFRSARCFLYADFVKRHIAKLFEFEWDEEDKDRPLHQSNGKEAYAGALTYYQIDLLFNGIFDKDAHPANFMETSPDSNGASKAKAHYKVKGIIESLSQFAIGDYLFPLFDNFKSGCPGDRGESHPEIDSIKFNESRFFMDTELSGTTWDEKPEQVVSRMTYAGMEQFLKVAISSSLLHYKAGLDHCRSQLTNDSLLIRINKTAGELRRDSLAPVLSAADLQAYTSVVSGKLPAFHFLRSTIKEIEQVTCPSGARKSTGLDHREWTEWIYSQFTLHNSLLHYKLYVDSIKNDIAEISRSLEVGRTDEIITELTDTRKLTEIATESVNRTIHEKNRRQLDMLTLNLTRLAFVFSVILAAAQIYVALGIWSMDRLFPDGDNSGTNGATPAPGNANPWNILIAIGIWLGGLMIIWAIYKVLTGQALRETADRKKKQRNRPHGSREETDGTIEPHVFDYSFFHEKLAHDHSSAKMIDELARCLPGIVPDEEGSQCASQSSFRETPLSAVERTKYTLESRDSSKKNGSYIFHIEVDRRMGRAEEYLREMRLVIKKPVEARYRVNECAEHIIYNCVNRLRFEDPSRVVELLDQQFHGAKPATERAAGRAKGLAAVRDYEDKVGAFAQKELELADKTLDRLDVPPTGGILVYNTDVLLAAGYGDRTMWALHRRVLDRACQVVIPLGRENEDGAQRWLKHLLQGCIIKSLNEQARREARNLIDEAEVGRVIEAHVVLTALRYRAAVLTLHSDTLERLAKAKSAQLRLYRVVTDQPEPYSKSSS